MIRVVIVHIYKEFKYNNGMIIRHDKNTTIIIDQDGNQKET